MLNYSIFLTALMLLEQTITGLSDELYTTISTEDILNKDKLIVQISNGQIRGQKNTTVGLNKPYYAYEGIPFAQPPVGNLRFEPPVPPNNWTGILNTTEYKGDCIKTTATGADTGSEDCLYINVYKPDVDQQELAVIVFISGGFYSATSNPATYGPDYLLDHNVIIVSLNYRLGIFGFLSTGDLVAPGNSGLKDQALALRWVKTNIANFGGDPDRITVLGQSAGAVSVSYHLTSKVSKGLFNKAIMESGSSLGLWALSKLMPEAVDLVAEGLNLTTSNSSDLVKALKNVNATTLNLVSLSVKNSIEGPATKGLVFAPVIEPLHTGAFITGKTHELLTKGKFHRVPILHGFNSMETLSLQSEVVPYYQNSSVKRVDIVPIDLNLLEADIDLVYDKIRNFYFGSEEIYNQTYQTYQFASNNLFNRAAVEANRLFSKHSRTYFYEFSYSGNITGLSDYPILGVPHSAELYYIWNVPINVTSITDNLVRKRLTKLWTNFAKFSNPTPEEEDLFDNVIWHRSDFIKDNLLYLSISSELDLKLNPKNRYIKFWRKIYEEYGNPSFDTY